MLTLYNVEGCHGKTALKQEEFRRQQIGLKLKEGASKELHLGQIFIWCWNLDNWESRSDITGKFWNVVLEKDGEDQLDRSCVKWRSIAENHGEEYLYLFDIYNILYIYICIYIYIYRLQWSRGSVLAFGTQVRGLKPSRSRRIFKGEKNPQHAFLRRGSKAVCPM